MKVLVLDAKENHALATTRSLSRHGFTVHCGEETSLSKSFYSKSCKDRFIYTSPRLNAQAFIDEFIARIESENYAAIFPMTEKTIWPISIFRERFSGKTILPVARHDVLLKAFNKKETILLAKQAGVAVPETFFPENIDELVHIANNVSYPVVVKPLQSENLISNRMVKGGSPKYANNSKELLQIFEEIDHNLPMPMIQEFIHGTGHGIFTLFKQGEPIVWFAHRRLRDVRPTGSGSSLRESVEVDAVMKTYSEKLLRAFGWEGVAMIEFRKDDRDGIPKLMEVNGRFWNSLPLAIAAGVDFPYLLYQVFACLNIAESIGYREGVKCRWLVGDIRHLIEVMRGRPAGFTGAFPARLPTLNAVIGDFFDKEMNYDVWSRNDPLPFFVELAEMLVRVIKLNRA